MTSCHNPVFGLADGDISGVGDVVGSMIGLEVGVDVGREVGITT